MAAAVCASWLLASHRSFPLVTFVPQARLDAASCAILRLAIWRDSLNGHRPSREIEGGALIILKYCEELRRTLHTVALAGIEPPETPRQN